MSLSRTGFAACYAAGAFVVALATLLALPLQAQAQSVTTYISNTGQTTDNASMLVRATAFTTGNKSGGYPVFSVAIYVGPQRPGTSPTPLVRIYEDTSGNPGSTLVATMTNPGTRLDDTVNIYTAPANTTLSASTTYWLVTSNSGATDGTGFQVRTVGTSTSDSGAAAGWSIGDGLFKGNILTDTSWTSSTHRILFAIRDNHPPTVANAIPDQSATENMAFRYVFPTNTFSDADSSDTLTYMATKADGTELPTWLTFAAGTRAFSGTPQAANVGTVAVKVTASDGKGGSVSDEFDIVVVAAHCTSNTNELWCAILTVDRYTSYTGYASGTDAYGSLNPSTFTYRMVTIGVTAFEYDADTLYFDVIRSAGTTPPDGVLGAGIYTLEIGTGGDKKSFVQSNPGRSTSLQFFEPGLSWSVGDTVPVKLVRAPNTAPTSADSTVTATEDTDYRFSASDFPFMDTDVGAEFELLTILTLPASGTLTLSNLPLTLPQSLGPTPLDDNSDRNDLVYTPPANANGDDLTSFTFNVFDGGVDSATHTLTIDVTAVNDAATGKPGITGTAQVGEVLTATVGTIADLDGLPDPFLTDTNTSFQWVRVTSGTDADILNATDGAYTLIAADEGKTIKLKVSFQDGDGGSEGPLTSDAYPSGGTVRAANIPPTVANAIPDQSATERMAFSYAFPTNTFSDVNSSDTLTYMATKADGNPLPTWLTFAATTRAFSGMPAAADVGTVAVKVTASDGNGGSVSDEFNIVVVAAHCTSNTNELWCAILTVGTVNDMGTTYYGYASGSDAYGGLAPSTFTYRMVTIDVVFFEYGANNLYFEFERSAGTTPPDGVLGAGIYTLEIGTGGDKKSLVKHNPGSSTTLNFLSPGLSWSSGDTVPIKLVRAPNTAPTSADSTVTATEDTDYAFLADRFPYMDMDAGARLVSVKIVTLPATGKGTLTLLDTALTSADLPQTVGALALDFATLKYVPPANANGDDFTSFTFRVNDGGVDSATHTMTIDVTAVDDPATGEPEITGTPAVGEVLTATVGTIADVDGLPDPFLTNANTSFQWIQVATDNTETDISGATASTYTLLAGDLGKTIKVKVTFTDDGNTAETLTSVATAAVSAALDNTAPRVDSIVRQSPSSSPTNANSLSWRVTFSENVANVDQADFTVSGTTATLSVSEVTASTVYDVTATGGTLNDLTATVTLGFANNQNITDTATNALTNTAPTGTKHNTFDVDNTRPTVTITDVPNPSHAPFTATFTFVEPVTGFAGGDITVGNGAASAFAVTDPMTYTALITPAADGAVTVDVAAEVATDVAGNGNSAAARVSSTYTMRSLSISVNNGNIAENGGTATLTVSATVAFSTDQIITLVDSGTAGLNADYTLSNSLTLTLTAGSTSVTATITAQDDNYDDDAETIVITASHDGTDFGSQTVTITDDDDAPTFSITVSDDSPSEAAEPTVTLTVSLGGSAFEYPTETISFALSGTADEKEDYDIDDEELIIPSDATEVSTTIYIIDDDIFEGDETIIITASHDDTDFGSQTITITDHDDDPNTPATGAPTITGTARVGQVLTATAGDIADVDGLPNPFLTDADTSFQWVRVATDNTEESISGATASTYTLVTDDLGTTIKVEVRFTDNASTTEMRTSAATAPVSAALETTPPTVMSIVRQDPASTPTNADTLTWRVTFSEPVLNVDTADFTVSGTTATVTAVSAAAGVANAYDVTASGGNLDSRNATVTLSFAVGQNITDAASNALANTTPSVTNHNTYVLDNTAPTVTITGVPNPSSAAFTATFTFLEPVTGFTVGDITLGNATASNFVVTSTTVYTALITPTAEAAFTVDVAANVATDAAGNGNTAAVQVSSTYSIGICPRTQQVRDAILGKISGVTNCALVTDLHLAAVSGTLDLLSDGITTLQPGDFAGLTALTGLDLFNNSLAALPAGVFAGLSALTRLELGNNSLAALPAGVFVGLSALTTLKLENNSLAALPAGVFADLGALTRLWLDNNSLAALPAGVFAGLGALTTLQLNHNGLTALPAVVFDDLGALTSLWLNHNGLTALPDGVFDDLGALTTLRLNNNSLTALPDGVFEDLGALTTLQLSSNSGAPFAPTAVAAPANPATVLSAGGMVTLAGSAPLSGNPWGANVTYKWDLTNPAGVLVTFANDMAATTTVTIPAQTAGTVLTFTLGVAGRASEFPAQTATTTVTVTETPTVTLALSDASISENGAASTVTATVSPASATAFTVTVSAAAVSPAVPADFNLSTNKLLSFATNATTSTGTVTITSVNNDVDAADKTVTVSGAVTASGVTAPAAVTLTIEDDDAAPTVANAIPDRSATVSVAFNYAFPDTTFTDTDGDTLTYMAREPDDTALPTWLIFNPTARAFSGTPAAGDVGTVAVKVTASDGNGGSVSDTFNIVVSAAADTTPPTVTSIVRQDPASTPTNADTLIWRVTFSEPVLNVDTADFTVSGTTATVTAVSAAAGEANAYDVTASGGNLDSRNDTVTLSFAVGQNITDAASNALSDTAPTGTNHNSYVLDNTAPTVTISGVPNPSSAAFTATFTFLEPVTGFAVGDITLGNATASNFAVTSTTVYTALITPTAEAAFTVDVAANVAADAAGNGNTAAVQVSSTYSIGICPRTQQVRDAILGKITGVTNCALVTDLHLAAVSGRLNLFSDGITTLQSGDFDGLSALTTLQLESNSLAALPDGVFDDLGALTTLQLSNNGLAALPDGVFDDLSALTELYLSGNSLTALPDGVFDDLGALTTLWLQYNGLTALAAGVFDDLGALTLLRLHNNSLAALPAGVFDDLSALTTLRLESNSLAALPDGVFEDLGALTMLQLSGNSGAPFAPTAVAAPANPATVLSAGGMVTLAGSAPLSGNPWGANVTYEWDLTNPAGVLVTFANDMAATTTVTIPAQTAGTVFTFTLAVAGRASQAAARTATTTVTVTETPTVTLALSDASISENGAASTVTATVSPASATAFTVTVSAAAVSPAVAADFNLSTNKILSFATNATASTGTVTITSVNNDVDAADKTVTVSGTVTASGVTAPPAVTLTIEDDDAAPTVANAIPDRSATVSVAFNYAFPDTTFTDTDGDTLTYMATQADNTGLPTWLIFNPTARAFSGTPAAGDVGTVAVKVTASDGNGGSVSDTFNIVVSAAANTPPGLVTAQVDGETLTLIYNEPLDTGSVPVPGDFSVSVNGHTAVVSDVALSGSALTLELAVTVVNTDTVTVTYTAGSNPIQDLAGNDAADISFPGRAVDNVTVSAPGAPGRLAAIPGNGQVGLGWAPPSSDGGAAIVRYEYRVSRDGGNNWSPDWTAVPDGPDTGSDAADERAYLVTGLANGTAYTFEVRASNSTHSGSAAQAEATPQTGTAADPDAPRGFAARAGDATVTLSWRTPLDTGNRPLLRYEVRHAQGSAISSSVSWQDVGTVLTYTMTGLTNGRQHTFEVRAVNTAGRAGAAARAQAMPEANADAPGLPGNLRAVSGAPYVDTSNGIDIVTKRAYVDVTLSWNAPAVGGDDPTCRYETRYRAGSAAWTAYRHVEHREGLMTTVAHLTPGTRYTFEVRAVNGAGPGAPARRQLTTARYSGATVTLQAGGSAREGEPFTLRATRSGSTAPDTYVFFELYDSAFPNGYRGGTPYHHKVAYFNGATATASYTPPFDGTRAGRTFTVRISSVNQLYDISGGLVTVSVADRDAGLRVADASVREGTGATLEFVVRLDRARDGAVTVEYATSAGSATAGLDYTEVSGTLSIPAGSRRASIEVPVLDDDIDDDRETLTLTLSHAVGAIIEDGVATGTIRNTDALPKAWLGRFGRSAAVQVVTLLDERFEAAAASDTRLVLGGRAVDVAALRTAPGEAAGRERPETGCGGGTGAPQECDTAERARLPGTGGYAEHVVRLDDQAGTFGQPGADPVRPAERAVRLDDQAGTFGQPGVDLNTVPGDEAVPTVAATPLERALWTLLTQRGRLQFDKRQFISQSSFDLSWAHLDGAGISPDPADSCAECAVMQAPDFSGRWSLWGRGALMQFSGQDNDVNVRGDVLTGLLGVDYARARWLAGAALAYHDGNGSYSAVRDGGTGDLDSVLVTVNPYLRYALTERLSVWGTLGYGAGALTLRQSGGQDADAVIETDLRMGMGALGLRGVVYAGEHTEWALKSDALWVRTSSAETAGMRSAAADTSRLRLLLSGQHQRALANDALLSPGVELGLRYDDGDAETGLGLELGAGLRYADSVRGLTVETKARALLAHEDGAYQEWGLSGSLSLDPGRLGRGLALRLDSGWGVADSGAEALWQRQTTAGIAPQHDSAAQRRITAEIGYGLEVPWTAAILTPYSGVEWAGSGRTLRLGWRFVLGQRLSLSLDGERTETGHTPPAHALMLRTSLPW